MAGKSRKATLIHLLCGMGNLPGIDVYRTPGEEAAISIVLEMVRNATLKELDRAAKNTEASKPFWNKQW